MALKHVRRTAAAAAAGADAQRARERAALQIAEDDSVGVGEGAIAAGGCVGRTLDGEGAIACRGAPPSLLAAMGAELARDCLAAELDCLTPALLSGTPSKLPRIVL